MRSIGSLCGDAALSCRHLGNLSILPTMPGRDCYEVGIFDCYVLSVLVWWAVHSHFTILDGSLSLAFQILMWLTLLLITPLCSSGTDEQELLKHCLPFLSPKKGDSLISQASWNHPAWENFLECGVMALDVGHFKILVLVSRMSHVCF